MDNSVLLSTYNQCVVESQYIKNTIKPCDNFQINDTDCIDRA